MPIDPDDQSDLRSLQEGEARALDRLILRWERRLLGFAWRYLHDEADARDVVAETFVRLHQQRFRLRPDTHLAAWLFTTTSHLCSNQQRWRRRHPTVPIEENVGSETPAVVPMLIDGSPGPEDVLEHKEALAALRQALAGLPHDLKTALLLHHYEQLSCREIGDLIGCSTRGVETRLYRARQLLHAALGRFIHETARVF